MLWSCVDHSVLSRHFFFQVTPTVTCLWFYANHFSHFSWPWTLLFFLYFLNFVGFLFQIYFQLFSWASFEVKILWVVGTILFDAELFARTGGRKREVAQFWTVSLTSSKNSVLLGIVMSPSVLGSGREMLGASSISPGTEFRSSTRKSPSAVSCSNCCGSLISSTGWSRSFTHTRVTSLYFINSLF